MKRILVTCAGSVSGVNFIKSLKAGPRRYWVLGVDMKGSHLVRAQRANSVMQVPPHSSPRYETFIARICRRQRIDMVHPQETFEVSVIAAARRKLPATLLPSNPTIQLLLDKEATQSALRRAGIPTPRLLDPDAAEPYPRWIRATHGSGAKGSCLAMKPEEAQAWHQFWHFHDPAVRLYDSEYLPGADLGWTSLWLDGKLVTSQGRERNEYIYPQHAVSGKTGTPVDAVTVHRRDLNRICTRAIKAIDTHYTGIACVDAKCAADPRRTPHITEINAGRFFTTSYGFTALGKILGIEANIPEAYVRLALGLGITQFPQYNLLPAGWYYLRHIDCDNFWVKGRPKLEHGRVANERYRA